MCRGEDDYLVEWLEFHRMMGVEHFFVYDNGHAASTKGLLAPFIAQGLVSYIPFPDLDWPGMRRQWTDYGRPSIQEVAYGHCLVRYRRHYRFLMRIDVDEFVYPAQKRHASLVQAMKELDLDHVAGIEIPMLDFGSSSHQNKPNGRAKGPRRTMASLCAAFGGSDRHRRMATPAPAARCAPPLSRNVPAWGFLARPCRHRSR
jgi:hypothetical protein